MTIQTRKTLVTISNHIIDTMWDEFTLISSEEYNNVNDIFKYFYKEIDGLHYYIMAYWGVDDTNFDYSIIRTNYLIPKKRCPSKGFFGVMKYQLGDRNRKFHIEEKLTNLNTKHQWYDRYDRLEDKKTKDYRMCNELTQNQYDVLENQYKKCKMPYGYKLEIFCGKPHLMYDGPDLLSITYKQFDLTVKEILNRTPEMRKKIINVIYQKTTLNINCIVQIMKFL